MWTAPTRSSRSGFRVDLEARRSQALETSAIKMPTGGATASCRTLRRTQEGMRRRAQACIPPETVPEHDLATMPVVLTRTALGTVPSILLGYLVVGEQRLAETVGEVAEVRHVEDRHVVRTPPALRLQTPVGGATVPHAACAIDNTAGPAMASPRARALQLS